MTATDDLATYRASADYQGFLAGILTSATASVQEAQAALNDAERSRRVEAVIAVRAGYGKTRTANQLGISRPTLDAWIRTVEADPDEMESVENHERFVERELKRGRISAS